MPDGIDIGHVRGLAFGRPSGELQDCSRGSEHSSWIRSLQTYHWHISLSFNTSSVRPKGPA